MVQCTSCLEIDLIETNGRNATATTWHSYNSNNKVEECGTHYQEINVIVLKQVAIKTIINKDSLQNMSVNLKVL